jgi:methylated-DNA-[protein]-cysteine S-methyltransferase
MNESFVRKMQFNTRFGRFVLFWCDTGRGPRVRRSVLPGLEIPAAMRQAEKGNASGMTALAESIRRFCDGRPVEFDLDSILLELCPPFQRQVLLAEFSVPRGRVTTYGLIAARLGKPGAARAVGQALARNPFPIVIPCHRALRHDGSLGGYQGGAAMKHRLLLDEGVEFDKDERVQGPFYAW